jgi:hypothetical protein
LVTFYGQQQGGVVAIFIALLVKRVSFLAQVPLQMKSSTKKPLNNG